ncbi:MAG: esterase FrsA [Candidatus Eremiobacteraeota bacterium]|nr:esterase FrsA [Candidatus Eremiobacteraeota bacterium]
MKAGIVRIIFVCAVLMLALSITTSAFAEEIRKWKEVDYEIALDDSKLDNDKEKSIMNEFKFDDESFLFQCLWRFGAIYNGGGDLGEMLTITSRIKDGDHESWFTSWNSMADHINDIALEFLKDSHKISAKEAFLRATNYYRSAEIFLLPEDKRLITTWRKGRNSFLQAAKLSNGLIEFVEIPFEDTTLPAYMCRVDKSGKKRPLLLIQIGLDGTAEDLYFILVAQALKRGYNCLAFEGPGQGEMIRIKKMPFRYNWETVVTPVVDYAVKLPEVDKSKIALIGYSMGGYLVPRAAAFEHRIKYFVVDGGVFSVYDGTMAMFSPEIKELVDDDAAEKKLNDLIQAEREKSPDTDKFIHMLLWTFDADSPFQVFRMLKKYSMEGVIDKIQGEMLVIGSIDDQVAGSYEQAKIFYKALKSPKTYLEFTRTEGGQFHCQLGAPAISSERILNWLDDRLK